MWSHVSMQKSSKLTPDRDYNTLLYDPNAGSTLWDHYGSVCGLFTCDMNVNIALGLRLAAQGSAESFPRLAPSLALALHTSLGMQDGVSNGNVRWKCVIVHSPACNSSMRCRPKYIWASCPASDVYGRRQVSKSLPSDVTAPPSCCPTYGHWQNFNPSRNTTQTLWDCFFFRIVCIVFLGFRLILITVV